MYTVSQKRNLLKNKYSDLNLDTKSNGEINNLFHKRQKNIFKRDFIEPDKALASTVQNETFRNAIKKAMNRLAKMEDNRYLNDPIIKKILGEWNTLNNSVIAKIESRITEINTPRPENTNSPSETEQPHNSPSATEEMIANIQRLRRRNGPSTPVASRITPSYLKNLPPLPPLPPPMHKGVLRSKFSDGQLVWYWNESASPLLTNPVVQKEEEESFHTHGQYTPYTPSSSGTIDSSASPQFKNPIHRTNYPSSTNSERSKSGNTGSRRELFK
jgi:hypothetical protein